MSTAFAQLLQAMVATLTAAPPLAGGRVHANRLRPIAAGDASAIVVRLEGAAQEESPLGYSDWNTHIALECYGRATSQAGAEGIVDDLLAALIARLHTIEAEALGAMHLIALPQIEWQRDIDATSEVCAIVRIVVRHRTQPGSLQAWA